MTHVDTHGKWGIICCIATVRVTMTEVISIKVSCPLKWKISWFYIKKKLLSCLPINFVWHTFLNQTLNVIILHACQNRKAFKNFAKKEKKRGHQECVLENVCKPEIRVIRCSRNFHLWWILYLFGFIRVPSSAAI